MGDFNGQERRTPDPIQEKIERLIVDAADPKDKAFLLLLNKIAENLDENTGLTRALSTDFKAHTEVFKRHEEAEMALINRGRGWWQVGVLLLVVINGMAAFIVKGHIERFDALVTDVAEIKSSNEAEIAKIRVDLAEHKAQHTQAAP